MTEIKIVTGDCLDWLRRLKPDSIDCCVTSPPYFGLRDYGTARWEGGDPNCPHRPDDTPNARGIASSTLGGGKNHTGHKQEGFKLECPRCGARRSDPQIGLEQTPVEYVAKLVEVFREVRRALKPTGTLWLNLGDSYAQNEIRHRDGTAATRLRPNIANAVNQTGRKVQHGLKPKDLIGIPWRVAFALQQDGWYLRQDIIWHKPNPMPESVRDRCTKAHEYLFLLTKSEKYHFDAAAIAEPLARPEEGFRKTPAKFGGANKFIEAKKQSRYHSGNEYKGTSTGTRNRRSVWSISPKPFKEAHFATFPPDLVEPCILAGCPEGGIVLDPFGGAGTTALVARQHNRKAVLIEINPAYVEIANRRLFGEMKQAAE